VSSISAPSKLADGVSVACTVVVAVAVNWNIRSFPFHGQPWQGVPNGCDFAAEKSSIASRVSAITAGPPMVSTCGALHVSFGGAGVGASSVRSM